MRLKQKITCDIKYVDCSQLNIFNYSIYKKKIFGLKGGDHVHRR